MATWKSFGQPVAVIAPTSFYHRGAIVSQSYVKTTEPVLKEEEAVSHIKATPRRTWTELTKWTLNKSSQRIKSLKTQTRTVLK